MAAAAGRLLYVTWHSREAAAVEPARAWLAGKAIRRVEVNWKEDVRVWHPGQAWIWEPGIGVFDPGINALSVITRILPRPLELRAAELRFPANKPAPIAADLDFVDEAGVPIEAHFDFDQKGPQTWDIDIETDQGHLKLSMGASKMAIDGVPVDLPDDPEYARLYRRFADLLARRASDADLQPFRHVADAFLIGRRVTVGRFAE
jgi:D-galactose 1-dehydrogenase